MALARRGSGKRLASGNRAPEMRFLAEDNPAVQEVLANGGFYDGSSGHTISGLFPRWYWAHEGDYYLGSPLSELVQINGQTAQWFDGGQLIATAEGRCSTGALGNGLPSRSRA